MNWFKKSFSKRRDSALDIAADIVVDSPKFIDFPNEFTQKQFVSLQIDDLTEELYGNYRGRAYHDLKRLHDILRDGMGDEDFLLFLQKQKRENPPPIWQYE